MEPLRTCPKVNLFVVFLLFAVPVSAQTSFQEDFSGGIPAGWQITKGSWTISEGRLKGGIYNSDVGEPPYDSNIIWTNQLVTDGIIEWTETYEYPNAHGGLLFRSSEKYNHRQGDHYALDIWDYAGSNANIRLYRGIDQKAAISTPSLNTPHQWKVELTGGNIKVSFDGQLKISYTDPNQKTGSYLGFWTWEADHQPIYFDNLKITVTQASPSPTPTSTPTSTPTLTPSPTTMPTPTPTFVPTPTPTATPTPTPTPTSTPSPTPIPFTLPSPSPTPEQSPPTPTPVTPPPPTLRQIPTSAPTPSYFREKPSVSLTSTKTSASVGEDALLGLSIVNPSVNDYDMTADILIRVPSGVSAESSSFAAGGANQFIGTFTVKPGQPRYITLRVKANEPGEKTIQGTATYFAVGNKEVFDKVDLSAQVQFTSPVTPFVPTPTPRATPGFELALSLAALLAIGVWVERRK
ncbi:MAG: hypothetical protein HY558_02020 [Euryarchaeota archaeon]|nr:hypothetical protein [Euryarchaeota archaeon]